MSKQLFAILILGLLACTGQSARVSISQVLEKSEAEDKHAARKSPCSKLESNIIKLCEYVPSKVHKLETKGISGWKGTQRIVVLGRKANALAASIKAFEQGGCEGDMTTAKEHLASVTTTIKQLALDGGETTARLATAISEAEARMAAEMAKPEDERDVASVQAAFMRTVLGGDGVMTDTEKNELTCKEDTCKTDQIVDEILAEPNRDHLTANETESLKLLEQQHSLLDVSRTKEVATTGNLFLDGLIGLTRFVCTVVLAIVGFVWFLAHGALTMMGVVAGVVGGFAATLICGMWWLLGQFVEFITLGGVRFGRDTDACFNTIWNQPFLKPGVKAIDAIEVANPWNYMEDVDWKLSQAASSF